MAGERDVLAEALDIISAGTEMAWLRQSYYRWQDRANDFLRLVEASTGTARDERDVLAAVMETARGGRPAPEAYLDRILAALAARGWRLVPSAEYTPGGLRYPTLHELHGGTSDLPMIRPEPLPREALDVEDLRAIFRERGWSIFMEAAYDQPLDPFPALAAALSPDRPTPP